MKIIKLIIKFFIHQFTNLIKLVCGKTINKPSLGSMTIDKDDVRIAKKHLKNSKDYYNEDIISEYEKTFAKWNGSKYAFSFMAGRVGLSACIYAIGLKEGDEVVVPAYTCVVVPNAFWYEKIDIKYCDIETQTFGIDFISLKNTITTNTKAIVVQHLYGLICRDYELIVDFAKQNGIYIIEDCAHATGAMYKGKKAGNFGDVAFYSSEHSKVFSTFNGGIAVTNNDAFAQRLKEYQQNAKFPKKEKITKFVKNIIFDYRANKSKLKWLTIDFNFYLFRKSILQSTSSEEENNIKPNGYGMRMPAPLAEIGLNQIKKIDSYNQLRRLAANKWENWTKENNFTIPLVIEESVPVFVRYPVLVTEEMKKNKKWSNKLGVNLGVWFTSNLHPSEYKISNCPNAERAVKTCINFPTILK